MQDKSINGLFRAMFNPMTYSIPATRQILDDYGGVLCLLNDLKTCHRQGIPSYEQGDHDFRVKAYGRNQLPPGQSLMRKSISQQRDFMVNFLFYLLTLRVCVKLLLVRDQYYGIQLMQINYQLSLYDQLISYILLLIMIFLKAMVNIQYFNMDQDQRKYKNQMIKVKRDGQVQQIEQKNLLVGDILITHREQIIRIDGIIMNCRKFLVSQAQTILRHDSKIKQNIWDDSSDSDPFILAGSGVVSGEAQILVCTVGQNCSFRIDKQSMSTIFGSPPLISRLKDLVSNIQNFAKVICVLLPTLKTTIYLLEKSHNLDLTITWIDFLYILKVYCSFIGLICLLQRLKILKSVNFFLDAHRSGKFFRIKNKSTFQKFSTLDILFIEWSTIAVRKRQQRDKIIYELDHISEISQINNYFSIKIITPQSKQKMKQIFGEDISDDAFFQPNQNIPHSQYLKMLMKATFITQSCIQDFNHKYLPIYKALKCQIGYVSNSLNPANSQIPEDILHIGFHRLQYTQNFKPIIQNNASPGYWVKLQNKIVMEDVLYEIIQESFVYANLFNTYFSLFVNNLFVFAIFCTYSFFNKPINLYYSLAIIIVNRYLFFTVYRRIALETSDSIQKKICFFEVFKLNILLLPYYIYVACNINFLSNLFIFFLVNSMLRIETLLFKVKPSKSIKHLLQYTALIFLINLINVIIWFDNKNWFNQELKNLGYTLGLICLFFAYAPLA